MDSNSSDSKMADAARNLVETVTSSVGNSQLKLQNTTNQHLADMKHDLQALKEEVKDLRKEAREADKMRRIEFAFQNVSFESKNFVVKQATKVETNVDLNSLLFVPPKMRNSYYDDQTSQYSITIKGDVLADILLTFRKGEGYYIDTYFEDDNNEYGGPGTIRGDVEPEKYQQFREKLSNKLHRLLGKKPTQAETNGRMAIFYD